MSATGRRRDAGVTLIEVLAAIAVTSLVGLVLFTNLRPQLLTYAQHQTVSVIAERLREAHAAALRRDAPVAAAVGGRGRALGVSGMAPTFIPAGVGLSSPDDRPIVFFGDGSSTGGVVWVTAASRSVPIWIVPATGSVAIGRKG
ncbi:MAG: prepilin-type N-terminal cleavage/methylation domain-containing protein [Caulobacteraceae bacterium]